MFFFSSKWLLFDWNFGDSFLNNFLIFRMLFTMFWASIVDQFWLWEPLASHYYISQVLHCCMSDQLVHLLHFILFFILGALPLSPLQGVLPPASQRAQYRARPTFWGVGNHHYHKTSLIKSRHATVDIVGFNCLQRIPKAVESLSSTPEWQDLMWRRQFPKNFA